MNSASQLSRFSRYSRYSAWALLILVPLSVLGVRSGILPVLPGLGLFALACLGATALLIITIVATMLPARSNQRPADLHTALILLAPAIVTATMLGGGQDVPAIHNITTDTTDPPQFSAAVAVRGPGANPLDLSEEVIAFQREAYPDLAPLVTELDAAAAFARASEVATSLGWEIYGSDPGAGMIEAVDTTFWFGFKDDIAIRIRGTASGSVIDLRSVSRVGRSDLGANAQRIRNFITAFSD